MTQLSRLVLILVLATRALFGQAPSPGRAAVSGRVTDAYGDPVLRARVLVETLGGSNTTRMVAAGETDDRGQYRIGRLSAGEYVIAVLRLDTFVMTPGQRQLRRVAISAATLGNDDVFSFDLTVNPTFVPAAVQPGNGDTRELGVRVFYAYLTSPPD